MSSLHRIWKFLIIIPLLIVASLVQALERGPQGTIQVGIFHVEPFNIIDQNKTPAGLNVDLLKEISREQKWTPQFVPVTWVEGLEGLQNEQIDLMVSVAYTPERAEVMDYNHESVLELWGQVFVRPEGKLKNINDLAGLRVGVMRKDINGSNFIKTAENLGVQCEIVEFPSYVEVFTAVQKNEVDAGIAHQHYGLRHAKAYNLVGSAMIFSPISIYFASKKGKHHELLGSIDAQLSLWKRDKDSYYYERVDYWLGMQGKRTKIPLWLIYTAITVALSLLVVSAFTLLLRRTVKISTAELHESEATFRKLFEDSSDAILLIDRTGVFVESNQAALDLLKMTREQLVLLPLARISPEFQPNGRRSAEAAPEMIALACAKGLHRFDWTCVNAQGGEFVVEIALMPITIKGQSMLHASWRDITERKRAEEENRRFRTIADNALYGKAIADLKGSLLYVNRFFANIHGYEPEQLVGKHLSSLHSEEQMKAVNQLVATMVGEGHFLPTTVWHHHRDGRDFPMLMSGIVIKDDYGKPRCLAASAIDITAQHQAEAKRIVSESILRDILESTLSGFWDWDLVANTEYLSPTFKRMFGYEDHEMENSPESWQKIIFPEDLPGVLEVFDRHVKSRGVEPFYNEIRYRHRNGSTIWVICAGRVIEWSVDGAPIRMVGCHVDITERKRAEEEKKLLNAQLQQAQKLEAIGTLAGGIAHDFNNILGAIVGYAEMIRDDFPPGSPSIHDINQVLKASHRAKDLVKQILAFSRQVEDQKIPLHPAVIVKEAITLLRSSLPTTITITHDIDADAGMVLANPTQIHQVVMNLATNAFHAMEVKGGTLTISLQRRILSQEDLVTEPGLQPGAFVQLSIKDSGGGILPEIREKIFDPFFTTKEVGKGTGLGLSMVYSIVKGCHGSVACDSWVGEGTEFRILLPVLEGHTIEDKESTALLPQGKERILLIDDEEILVELGQAMLKRLGYHVTTRGNSLDALTTFQNQPDQFDLIITDQTMPGMTGVDLARRILQLRPEMPIILCTGYSSQISEDKAQAAGIRGFAYKPLAKKDIGELIRKVLDGKKS